MIRINLAPEEELQNPYPWIPDLSIFALTLVVGFVLMNFFIHLKESDIDTVKNSINRMETSDASWTESERLWRQINVKNRQLEEREKALRMITESKLARYRPVLLMEHLQTLKPEGVWLSKVQMLKSSTPKKSSGLKNSKSNASNSGLWDEITVQGHALDHVLLADFISALKSTQTQDVEPSDLRTQIYFDMVSLQQSRASDTDNGECTFDMVLRFKERVSEKHEVMVSDMVWPGGVDVLKF